MVNTNIDLQVIPLAALTLKTRNVLGSYLDATKVLPSPEGLSRDWRGICHLSRLSHQYESFLSSKMNPTMELIKILVKERTSITFSELMEMLGRIDRWDIVDETSEAFVSDAVEYLKQQEKYDRGHQQIIETSNEEIYPNCLTIDDIKLAEKGLPLQQYDVFILFADKDIDFGTEMIDHLEADGFNVCVKERDFLAGLTFEHDAIRHLLTERCERLIVIISPDFVCSPLNAYIANLAQSLGIAQQRRKIIPCVYKPCQLPEIFKHIHLLNYQRSQKFYNFWDKLKLSLRTTPQERIANQCPQITITEADQPTVAPTISISNDVEDLIDSPVRSRKRNTTLPHQHTNEFVSLPSTPPETETDPSKKFWPPSPKLRPTRSMVNLTDLDNVEPNNNSVELPLKKAKWYSKLSLKIAPQGLKLSGSESNLSKQKTKPKKNIWRRIKLASHS